MGRNKKESKRRRIEHMVLQYIEIPELSLSPGRMLGPLWTSFCACVSLSAFLMDAPDAYTHCTLGIDQPVEAKSLSQTSLQPFRRVSSMLQCNTRACSPTRGLYYVDIVEDIVCRKTGHHDNEGESSFFNIFLSKNWGVYLTQPSTRHMKHENEVYKKVSYG